MFEDRDIWMSYTFSCTWIVAVDIDLSVAV